MKTPILFFAASASLFFLCCETCPPIKKTESFYHLVNCSGHTVSIVHDPPCIELPDSLILANEMEFVFERDWSSSGVGTKPFFYITDTPDRRRIIYFDGRYALDFSEVPEERKFFIPARYERKSEFNVYFTFTEADYDYAVANGRDLGE